MGRGSGVGTPAYGVGGSSAPWAAPTVGGRSVRRAPAYGVVGGSCAPATAPTVGGSCAPATAPTVGGRSPAEPPPDGVGTAAPTVGGRSAPGAAAPGAGGFGSSPPRPARPPVERPAGRSRRGSGDGDSSDHALLPDGRHVRLRFDRRVGGVPGPARPGRDLRRGSHRGGQRVQPAGSSRRRRSEEHTSELQSRRDLVCRLLLEKKKKKPSTRLCSQDKTKRSQQQHSNQITN